MKKKTNLDTQIVVRFNSLTKEKMEAAAEKSNEHVTAWIRRACDEKLEREELKKRGLAEQKAAYIDGKLIDAIKYALTLPEVQLMIKDMLWKKNE